MLLRDCLPARRDAIDQVLAVFVELELRDDALAWGDADGDRLAVGLLTGNSLDLSRVRPSRLEGIVVGGVRGQRTSVCTQT